MKKEKIFSLPISHKSFIPTDHILVIDHPEEKKFLRKKTEEINPELFQNKTIQKELRGALTAMRALMRLADGVGLSANQAGIPYRFFVARAPGPDGKWKQYAVFNPIIKKTSKDMKLAEEGCLSVPGKYGPVERHATLLVEGLNLQGRKIKIEAKGLLARICQHEIDHLNGVLFIDKAKYVEDVAQSDSSPQI